MKRFNLETKSTFDYASPLLPALKDTLRILDNTEDSKLLTMLELSTAIIERWTGLTLNERVFSYSYTAFEPSKVARHGAILPMPRTPILPDALQTLTIHYSDSNAPLEAESIPLDFYGEIKVKDENEVVGELTKEFLFTAEFKAGYPEVDGLWTCPALLQQAIIAMTAYWYSHPTECSASGCNSGSNINGTTVPLEVAILIDSFKIKRIDYGLYF